MQKTSNQPKKQLHSGQPDRCPECGHILNHKGFCAYCDYVQEEIKRVEFPDEL